MNGDWIDGTGLAMNGDPSALVPVLEKMPWDAVNVGNHELYRKSVIDYIIRPAGFAEWWGSKYLSSNIIRTGTVDEPMGNKFTYLVGDYSTVLVFGFLYNMVGYDTTITVQKVEDAISEGWFEEALMGTSMGYDAILVLAHMDHQDSLVKVILDRIRKFVESDMPVQFVTGHTHYRGYSAPDNYSSSFEAGRYLDTVGFVSFPTQTKIREATAYTQEQDKKAEEKAAKAAASANATDCLEMDTNSTEGDTNSTDADTNSTDCVGSNSTSQETGGEPDDEVDPTDTAATAAVYKSNFEHVFIDAKYTALQDILGVERVETIDGLDLSLYIERVQRDLGLFQIVGCIEEDHFLEKGLDEPNSLWGLFCSHVVPHVFPWEENVENRTHKNPMVVLLAQDTWRYDLHARELVLDEVIAVSPYNDTLSVFPGVSGTVLFALNQILNGNGHAKNWMSPNGVASSLPEWVMCDSPAVNLPQPLDPDVFDMMYDLVVEDFALNQIRQTLELIWQNVSTPDVQPEPRLIPHHTTTSMWLQFFDETKLCQTDSKGTQKEPPKNSGGQHHPPIKDKNNEVDKKKKNPVGDLLGDAFEEGDQLDHERVTFVWVACLLVIVLFGVYVRKRARIFRSEMHAQEMASLQALEEYNQQLEARERYSDRNFSINDDYDATELL
ncbi:hypothetical protein ACA910_005989 [Epithemia clementina (nom. ined.)]